MFLCLKKTFLLMSFNFHVLTLQKAYFINFFDYTKKQDFILLKSCFLLVIKSTYQQTNFLKNLNYFAMSLARVSLMTFTFI